MLSTVKKDKPSNRYPTWFTPLYANNFFNLFCFNVTNAPIITEKTEENKKIKHQISEVAFNITKTLNKRTKTLIFGTTAKKTVLIKGEPS
jgi:uncharacterized protein YhbP (UPF0306 family)